MERIQKGGNCSWKKWKRKSSVLFPLTGNCVFDLSHHTHLVIACEVSLFPMAERKKCYVAASVLTGCPLQCHLWKMENKIAHLNKPGIRKHMMKEHILAGWPIYLSSTWGASCLLWQQATVIIEHYWPSTVRDEDSHLSDNQGVCP